MTLLCYISVTYKSIKCFYSHAAKIKGYGNYQWSAWSEVHCLTSVITLEKATLWPRTWKRGSVFFTINEPFYSNNNDNLVKKNRHSNVASYWKIESNSKAHPTPHSDQVRNKVGTHEGTSLCDWRDYTKGLVARTCLINSSHEAFWGTSCRDLSQN